MLTLFPEPNDAALVEKLKALNDYYGFEHPLHGGMVFDFLAVLCGARASIKTIGEYVATIGDYANMPVHEVENHLLRRYTLLVNMVDQPYFQELLTLNLAPELYAEHFLSGCSTAMPVYQGTMCVLCPNYVNQKCWFGGQLVTACNDLSRLTNNQYEAANVETEKNKFYTLYENLLKKVEEGNPPHIPSNCPYPPESIEEAALNAFDALLDAAADSGDVNNGGNVDADDDTGDGLLQSDSSRTYANKRRRKPRASRSKPSRPGKGKNRCFFGFDFANAQALADFMNSFNFAALKILNMSGKFKDILDSISDVLNDTHDPTDAFEMRNADTEKLDKIVTHQQAIFNAEEQLMMAEAGSLQYSQQQIANKKLYYILIDTSGSMGDMLNNGYTAAEVAAAVALSFVDEAAKVGKFMFRTFDESPSELFMADNPQGFTLARRKIITCAFNGGGTSIDNALKAALSDYITKVTPDITKADTILITDAQDSVNDEILKELTSHCDFHFIHVSSSAGYNGSDAVLCSYAKSVQSITGDNFDQFKVVETIAKGNPDAV